MFIILACLLNLCTFSGSIKDPGGKNMFISPVKIPMSLSANFGELRIDHFHSGLDIKTQGVTGKEVVAAAPGYVYRISVSPGGFGRALYLRHPSGYSTVYGHLDRFAPDIEKYVVSRQYEEKSFMISLWPPKDKFEFNQGDIIGYSGNSGSSSGPHLHYEIRRADEEIPVNPLRFEFGIADDIKPTIEKLFIYPVNEHSSVNSQKGIVKINVTGGNGKYYLSSKDPITINGLAGFGIKAFDLLNNSNNKCTVYSINLMIDSVKMFGYSMDEFGFSESRYVNSHIDYETYMRDNIYVERTFLLPNDKLKAYQDVVNNGLYNFNDGKKHRIEIVVADIHNNRSSLIFNVKSIQPESDINWNRDLKDDVVIMPYGRNNKFVARNLIVNIPSGALYDTLKFEFKRSQARPDGYSDVYNIHNKYTPVHKVYSLSIKPDRIPAGKESKLLIIQLLDAMQKVPLPTSWENDYLVARPWVFGTFYVGIDTLPPQISANGLSSGADLSGKSSLKIKISDDLSGIKSYDPFIDGKWALFEYDQKNNVLIYDFDPERIQRGKKHTLDLKVADNRDNVSTYRCEFTW